MDKQAEKIAALEAELRVLREATIKRLIEEYEASPNDFYYEAPHVIFHMAQDNDRKTKALRFLLEKVGVDDDGVYMGGRSDEKERTLAWLEYHTNPEQKTPEELQAFRRELVERFES